MATKKVFYPDQFTDFITRKWSTKEDKAKFANQFVKFVRGGYQRKDFPKWFYQRLSNCFGFCAEYNIEGFYDTYFTCGDDIGIFKLMILTCPCYGSPQFTYSDVEKELKDWMRGVAV